MSEGRGLNSECEWLEIREASRTAMGMAGRMVRRGTMMYKPEVEVDCWVEEVGRPDCFDPLDGLRWDQ
jgi:hypothetical protein